MTFRAGVQAYASRMAAMNAGVSFPGNAAAFFSMYGKAHLTSAGPEKRQGYTFPCISPISTPEHTFPVRRSTTEPQFPAEKQTVCPSRSSGASVSASPS